MEKSSTLSPAKQALLEQRLKRASHARVKDPEIPKRPDRDSASLSFAQRQMWVIDQMTPGNPAYNVPVGYRIKGALDVTALEDSVNEIIKRHEVLRTTFAVKDGEPLQFIHPTLTIKTHITELDHLPAEEREDRLQALASEESVRSFELSRLPLIRVSLFKLGEAENVVIINLHHIVADGLSIGLMLDELDTFYRAYTGGEGPRPPDLAVQYADFAQWQRRTLANEAAYANQIEFWRKQFDNGLPVLELPGDRPRPTLQSFKGSNVFFNIPTSLAEDLRLLGAREGCTFFMTLLAAFQVLLHRYTGAEDMVIGTPVGARIPRALEPLIGNFLNMAALRCDLSGNPTFIELLRRTRETTLNAFSNNDLPFEAMLKHVTFERDPSRNPIFQTLLQVLPTAAPRIGDLDISSFHFDLKFAQFDLSLLLYEDVGGYSGRFEYCTDLFEARTIRRMCEHYRVLLNAIVCDPDQSISMLPLLTDAERHQLLIEWNRTESPYPNEKCIHQLFEAQAERTPDAVAVVFEDQRLTYRELNQRANQLAHHLQKLGVGPEVLVGICVERSLEIMIGLLGIWKAGGAYVPLDPTYPTDRLAFIMEDSQLSVLVTQRSLANRLPGHITQVLCLDQDLGQFVQESISNPVSKVTAQNLAYIIYTSGTTGNPKGVMIEHGSLVNYLCWFDESQLAKNIESLPLITPLTFDASLKQLFALLLRSRQVWILPDDVINEAADLLTTLSTRVRVGLNCVPALWSTLLDAIDSKRAIMSPHFLSSLFLGGEQLDKSLIDRTFDALPHVEIWNLYGPTEATANAIVGKISRGKPISLGRPIANTKIYILDSHLQPVPVGIPGELHIGGVGLARGYLNCPELTNGKFIPSPFGSSPDERIFKTGDLARYLPNGNIEFLGRIDNQIKIRGFRIEPGEVEAFLRQYPGLRDTVVLARKDKTGDKRLVAYVLRNPGHDFKSRELRSFLKRHLPDYMVPSAFVVLDRLPLTPNGKIDRKALPIPGQNRSAIVESYQSPRTTMEETLASIWAEVLVVKKVGIHDNFFDLGGHSLLAVRMVNLIKKRIGRTVRVASVFQAPTVERMASVLHDHESTTPCSSLVPLQTKGSKPAFFWVHGDVSNAYLPRYLDSEQRVYGLQHQSTDGQPALYRTVEEIATHYLTEIYTVQPHGPYRLGGYCFGGLVALEMANQLQKQGKKVDLLALLNPASRKTGTSTVVSSPIWTMGNDLRHRLQLISSVRPSSHWNDVLNRVKGRMSDHMLNLVWSVKRPTQKTICMICECLGVSIPVSLRSRYILEIYRQALQYYVLRPFQGDMVLFLGQDFPRQLRVHWSKQCTGSVTVHDVPGDHVGAVEDRNVKVWAVKLASCLDALET